MFIRVTKSPTAKFSKVYLVEGYRDELGKSKQRVIKCYGNLEELQVDDPNILDNLRKEAKQIPSKVVNLKFNLDSANNESSFDLNYGYFFLESIYEKLGISPFMRSLNRKLKCEYDLNKGLQLLVFSRILNPVSKLSTFENRKFFFEPFDVTLDSIYRNLSVFNDVKEDLQLLLHKNICKSYDRDCSLVFYDVTNYYFETEKEDKLKKVGVSKENRKSPIVQMGLFIDKNGIPISYKLFPGNMHDSNTLIPIVEEIKKRYSLERIILTADKGLNSGKNLIYLANNNDGYVVSQKVRGASKEFIEMVLDEDGYCYNENKTFKIKSFLREHSVKDDAGKNVKLTEKVVCFWSKDFNDREKHKREDLEAKLDEFQKHPSKYNSSNSYGIKKYLKLKHVNKETGEIEKVKPYIEFNQEKYDRDVALDGYYTLITSEIELPETEIIEKYRGLWKIEESFKVIKSDLEGRPVFVRREDRIEGHFLVCYIALVILRILELKLGHKYSIKQLQKALNDANYRPLQKGICSLKRQTETFKAIEEAFNVNLDYSMVELEKLREYRKKIVHNKNIK